MGMLLALPLLAGAQAVDTVRAARTEQPVVLDGRDDDPVWQRTSPTGGFLEIRPNEGGTPAERTAFRVAYDPANLYVFVRLYDTAPDSIVGLLSSPRRGHRVRPCDPDASTRTTTDGAGFEFAGQSGRREVGLRDLQRRPARTVAWDAVWDVATRIDSLGWTAEYRIPFSQLTLLGPSARTHVRESWYGAIPAAIHRRGQLAAVSPVAHRFRVAVRDPGGPPRSRRTATG